MPDIIKKFNNKKIALLGLGAESRALLEFLAARQAGADICVCDARKNVRSIYDGLSLAQADIKWQTGLGYDSRLHEFDLIVRAPGYPLNNPNLIRAQSAGTEISSATKLFFEASPTSNIIGVTGTKGKGTTSGLIVAILQNAGLDVHWGGNIGIPIFSFFSKLSPRSLVVLELSSFQLEDLDQSPHIAVITNFSKEHLAPADPANPNFHKTIDVYRRAKLNILRWQDSRDFAVLNKKLDKKAWLVGSGAKVFFEKSDLPSLLVGEHNKENIGAAAAVARILRVKQKIVRQAVENFSALPHRLEFAGEYKGVLFYDDSFATTPEAAMTAINSFGRPIVLLAGGADKGSGFSKLARLIKDKVKYVIFFPGLGTDRLRHELRRIGYGAEKMEIADSMKEAVSQAKSAGSAGDIVLLSPACASFGVFSNYKERGELFKKEI